MVSSQASTNYCFSVKCWPTNWIQKVVAIWSYASLTVRHLSGNHLVFFFLDDNYKVHFEYLILTCVIHERLRFGRRADPDVPRVSAASQHDWRSGWLDKKHKEQNKIHVKSLSSLKLHDVYSKFIIRRRYQLDCQTWSQDVIPFHAGCFCILLYDWRVLFGTEEQLNRILKPVSNLIYSMSSPYIIAQNY